MVKREKFLEDAKASPTRFYRSPNDVLRDRRLSDGDRRDILSAWQRTMTDDTENQGELLASVQRALDELSLPTNPAIKGQDAGG